MTARAAVGLLGGTFDPVHNGHLRVAIEAAEALQLAEVRLLPLNVPGHRAPAEASAAQRCSMLETVMRPPLVLDRSEIDRGGVSYTVETLECLRAAQPDVALCLILGLDSFRTLPAWHRPQDILTLAHLVVAARPDVAAALPGLDDLIGTTQSVEVADFHDKRAGHVFFLDLPLLPIASSDLRARLRAGRSIRHLVPDAVDDLIQQHHLYAP